MSVSHQLLMQLFCIPEDGAPAITPCLSYLGKGEKAQRRRSRLISESINIFPASVEQKRTGTSFSVVFSTSGRAVDVQQRGHSLKRFLTRA